MSGSGTDEKLQKSLTLFDVFAIATGAMFSSGFFLLPGLASAEAGPAVVLAYFLAGLLMVPAMLSMAELSTAMPRAGGAYYFLDRSLGPLVGTVGGLGTWVALILKSAFAIIGMGAYLALFVDVPMQTLAVVLTVFFTLVNLVGAKESGQLQSVLVVGLLAVLLFFVVQGFVEIFTEVGTGATTEQFRPFLPFGTEGLFSTIGLVFVSYAGLTKVASVAEEVKDPDRNIPLGMALSLAVATAAYVLGVFIMVAVLDPGALREDLTPAATAAEAFFDWLPGSIGLMLIVGAAIAAFASTGNAGILSASRYLLAMGRDHVVWPRFAELGRFRTPTLSLLVTGAVMILVLLTLDVMSVAKLASAFQLLVFAFVNLAVVVLRESRIEGYDPAFSSPLDPWMHIWGIRAPCCLTRCRTRRSLLSLTVSWFEPRIHINLRPLRSEIVTPCAGFGRKQLRAPPGAAKDTRCAAAAVQHLVNHRVCAFRGGAGDYRLRSRYGLGKLACRTWQSFTLDDLIYCGDCGWAVACGGGRHQASPQRPTGAIDCC